MNKFGLMNFKYTTVVLAQPEVFLFSFFKHWLKRFENSHKMIMLFKKQ